MLICRNLKPNRNNINFCGKQKLFLTDNTQFSFNLTSGPIFWKCFGPLPQITKESDPPPLGQLCCTSEGRGFELSCFRHITWGLVQTVPSISVSLHNRLDSDNILTFVEHIFPVVPLYLDIGYATHVGYFGDILCTVTAVHRSAVRPISLWPPCTKNETFCNFLFIYWRKYFCWLIKTGLH